MSEGLDSDQWFRHLLTEANMARSSLTDVEKDSLKRPALVFTDSDRFASTVKKEVGQSHDKRFRIVLSMLREGFRSVENISLTWLPTHLQVADPFEEDDGEGYSSRVLQLSCVPVRSPQNLRVQGRYWKLVRIALPRNEF